jgi:hypothetical protein
MSSTSALRRGSDAGAVASGIGKYAGRLAIALIDASIIGASAVALSTAYAIGDVLSLRHSLHRREGLLRRLLRADRLPPGSS